MLCFQQPRSRTGQAVALQVPASAQLSYTRHTSLRRHRPHTGRCNKQPKHHVQPQGYYNSHRVHPAQHVCCTPLLSRMYAPCAASAYSSVATAYSILFSSDPLAWYARSSAPSKQQSRTMQDHSQQHAGSQQQDSPGAPLPASRPQCGRHVQA